MEHFQLTGENSGTFAAACEEKTMEHFQLSLRRKQWNILNCHGENNENVLSCLRGENNESILSCLQGENNETFSISQVMQGHEIKSYTGHSIDLESILISSVMEGQGVKREAGRQVFLQIATHEPTLCLVFMWSAISSSCRLPGSAAEFWPLASSSLSFSTAASSKR